MRVLVVSNLYPPRARGGYERICADVVDRWRAAGHEVVVLTSAPGDAPEPGVERSLPMTSAYGLPPPLLRRAGIERAARRTVDGAVDRVRPDVALVFNLAGLPVSVLRQLQGREVPMLFVVGDEWPARVALADPWVAPFHGSAARRVAGRLAARVGGTPTAVPRWAALGRWTFASAALRDLVAAGTQQRFDDALVVPHGVDTRDFPVDDGPDAGRPWGWRLVYVGRLDAEKGIDTLVRALAALPEETTLDVCAPEDAEHVARLSRVIAEVGAGDRVRIGSVERDRIAARYRGADACVFPSEWDEPFGIVPLEAMACSTPVVASGTGGSAEFLRDGENCVVARPGDPEAIAAAVRRLAADPDLRARLVAGGRATAASLTTDHLAEELERIALDLVAR